MLEDQAGRRGGAAGGDPASEPAAPVALKKMQRAFAAAIAEPFTFRPPEPRPRPERYPCSALRAIAPSARHSPALRLMIYNQQYWFRLLTVMQQEFPLLRQLLGITAFNPLAMAYLQRYPSRSTSLRNLSDHIREFLQKRRGSWGRTLLREAALLDWIHIQAFDAAILPALKPGAEPAVAEALASRPLRFQPHFFLFEEHWNLVEQRGIAVARKDDAEDDEDDLPRPRRRHRLWAVARHGQRVESFELKPLQHALLSRLRAGRPFAQAVADIAARAGASRRLGRELHDWFAVWSAREWFAAAPNHD